MPPTRQQVAPPETPGATPGGTGPSTGTATSGGGATTPTDGVGAGAGAGTGGGGSGGGGWLSDVPDPWEMFTEILAGILAAITDAVAALIDQFSWSLLTLPAAGDSGDPATWLMGVADDPYWQALITVYVLSTGVGVPIVWGVGWFNVAVPRGHRRRERLLALGKMLGAILAGWFLLQFWFHFWNEATMLFAPSGEEFLSTPGNAAKFGGGLAAIAGFVMTGNSIFILIGVLIHAVFIFLTFALVGLFPISVTLHYSEVPVIQTIGTSTVVVTLLLHPLQFVKGALLRVLFELPLSPSDPETLFSFVLIVVGVAVAFVGVPLMGLKRLLPRTIIGAGLGQMHGGRAKMSDLRERAPSRSELVANIRNVTGDTNAAKSKLGHRGGSTTGTGSSLQSRARRNRRRSYTRSTSQTPSRRGGVDTRSRSRSGQSAHTGNVAYRQQRRRRREAARSGTQNGSGRQRTNGTGRGR